MTAKVITPPGDIIDLDDVRAHLRIDHGDDDFVLQALIKVAQRDVAKAINCAVGVQTLEYSGRPCRGVVSLPLPPFIALVSAIYFDVDGEAVEMDVNAFEVRAVHQESVNLYLPSWPGASCRPDAYRIQYTAGISPEHDHFSIVRLAMLMLIAQWYEHREVTGRGSESSVLPHTVSSILSRLNVWSV